jgi:hypothetical protein
VWFLGCFVAGVLVLTVPVAGRADASEAPTISDLSASKVHERSATVSALIEAHGVLTEYQVWIEYDSCEETGTECVALLKERLFAAALAGEEEREPVSYKVGVKPGCDYSYWFVAINSGGTATSARNDFITPNKRAPEETHEGCAPTRAPPSEVVTEPAELDATGAKLNGKLNPNGLLTTYYFEYIGSNEDQCLEAEVENCWHTTRRGAPITGDAQRKVRPIKVSGLTVGVTYRYRLVASNAAGTARGNVARFTFVRHGREDRARLRRR